MAWRFMSWVQVPHTCNPNYLGGWGQENHGSRSTQENSLWDAISKITRPKWTGGVAQAVEHLLCKLKALSSTPSCTKDKKFMNVGSTVSVSKIWNTIVTIHRIVVSKNQNFLIWIFKNFCNYYDQRFQAEEQIRTSLIQLIIQDILLDLLVRNLIFKMEILNAILAALICSF
jgi:hypothetical protein